MFSFRHNEFIKYVAETSDPLYIDVECNPENDAEYHNDIYRISVLCKALSVNTKSKKFVLSPASDQYTDMHMVLNNLKIPENITTFGFPRMIGRLPEKFVLPSSIQELCIDKIDDLFDIDFSNTSNLQRIDVEYYDVVYDGYYGSKLVGVSDRHNHEHVDLLHQYELYQVCFEGYCAKHKDIILHIMKNIKLPYSCQIIFNDESEKNENNIA